MRGSVRRLAVAATFVAVSTLAGLVVLLVAARYLARRPAGRPDPADAGEPARAWAGPTPEVHR